MGVIFDVNVIESPQSLTLIYSTKIFHGIRARIYDTANFQI